MGVKQSAWISDFVFTPGRVRVPSTGADLKLDWLLVSDALRWMTYYALVRVCGWWNGWRRPTGLKLYFTPAPPRPWYIAWAACVWAGIGFAAKPEEAVAAFYFEDQTWGRVEPQTRLHVLNETCTDISKSRVATVFEDVFGYPLAIDPTTWEGIAVEKGEKNGAHDGQVVQCPTARQPGKTYQRLIETGDGVWAHDLRTPCVGGVPILVFVKGKLAAERFSIQNKTVTVKTPAEIFSAEEIATITRFCVAMGLDWGGLDILREKSSGRLFVVDVNKTDTGPAVILSWKDRIRVTSLLADALTKLVRRHLAARP
jgi:hypothetical protein